MSQSNLRNNFPLNIGCPPEEGEDGNGSSQVAINNFDATTDPTATNDSTEGYGLKSYWYNKTKGNLFVLVDGTENNAVWVKVNTAVAQTIEPFNPLANIFPEYPLPNELGIAHSGGVFLIDPVDTTTNINLPGKDSNDLEIGFQMMFIAVSSGLIKFDVVGNGDITQIYGETNTMSGKGTLMVALKVSQDATNAHWYLFGDLDH